MSVCYCSVDGCFNKVGDGLSFFRCPKDEQRILEWKNALGFTEDHRYASLTADECNSRIRVCSVHFSENCFSNVARNRIYKYAVPSLNLRPLTSGNNESCDTTKLVAASIQTDFVYEDTKCLCNRTRDNLLADLGAPPRKRSSPSERVQDNLLYDSVAPPRNVSSPSESETSMTSDTFVPSKQTLKGNQVSASKRVQDNLLDDSVAPPRNISSPSERVPDTLLDDSVAPPRNISYPSERVQDNWLDDSVAPSRNIASPNERVQDNWLDDSVAPSRNIASPNERLEDSDMHPDNQPDDIQIDEWYYLGKNIAYQLRSLPLDRALVVQQKILDLFTQERIDCIVKVKMEETNT